MDLRVFASTLLRRWYLTLAVLLLAVAAGAGLTQVVGPTYSATSSVVLIPPEAPADKEAAPSEYAPENPLLYLGSLTQSRDLLLTSLRSQRVADGITEQVPGATYEAVADALSSGPIIVLTVEAPSSEGAIEAIELVTRTAGTELVRLQKSLGITDANQIGSFRLASDTEPTAEHKKQVQIGVVGAAGVALAGLLLIALGDGLRARRGRSAPVVGESSAAAGDGAAEDVERVDGVEDGPAEDGPARPVTDTDAADAADGVAGAYGAAQGPRKRTGRGARSVRVDPSATDDGVDRELAPAGVRTPRR
ncbi:capsular polysaccharide biosynthesis protein [Terracoccus luteus]|uniref:Capsular polysaccharide biosynthesis protein n=1 Tax=Terracoccus luteus TaxID=53356 RepID=A0A495XYU1_9MICO|nr:hypothetical protein [Terracoccus luteus]RKT78489.1 capsular polysaccharide biosynthesis protein [Terracoccus luteus]